MMMGATGNVSAQNITVTRVEAEEGAFYARVGRGAERKYAVADVLSAGYARRYGTGIKKARPEKRFSGRADVRGAITFFICGL